MLPEKASRIVQVISTWLLTSPQFVWNAAWKEAFTGLHVSKGPNTAQSFWSKLCDLIYTWALSVSFEAMYASFSLLSQNDEVGLGRFAYEALWISFRKFEKMVLPYSPPPLVWASLSLGPVCCSTRPRNSTNQVKTSFIALMGIMLHILKTWIHTCYEISATSSEKYNQWTTIVTVNNFQTFVKAEHVLFGVLALVSFPIVQVGWNPIS